MTLIISLSFLILYLDAIKAYFLQRRVIHKNGGREERSSRIELSTKVLDSADRLRDTLVKTSIVSP